MGYHCHPQPLGTMNSGKNHPKWRGKSLIPAFLEIGSDPVGQNPTQPFPSKLSRKWSPARGFGMWSAKAAKTRGQLSRYHPVSTSFEKLRCSPSGPLDDISRIDKSATYGMDQYLSSPRLWGKDLQRSRIRLDGCKRKSLQKKWSSIYHFHFHKSSQNEKNMFIGGILSGQIGGTYHM